MRASCSDCSRRCGPGLRLPLPPPEISRASRAQPRPESGGRVIQAATPAGKPDWGRGAGGRGEASSFGVPGAGYRPRHWALRGWLCTLRAVTPLSKPQQAPAPELGQWPSLLLRFLLGQPNSLPWSSPGVGPRPHRWDPSSSRRWTSQGSQDIAGPGAMESCPLGNHCLLPLSLPAGPGSGRWGCGPSADAPWEGWGHAPRAQGGASRVPHPRGPAPGREGPAAEELD